MVFDQSYRGSQSLFVIGDKNKHFHDDCALTDVLIALSYEEPFALPAANNLPLSIHRNRKWKTENKTILPENENRTNKTKKRKPAALLAANNLSLNIHRKQKWKTENFCQKISALLAYPCAKDIKVSTCGAKNGT